MIVFGSLLGIIVLAVCGTNIYLEYYWRKTAKRIIDEERAKHDGRKRTDFDKY